MRLGESEKLSQHTYDRHLAAAAPMAWRNFDPID